ncbi:hypothetical protein JO83_02985 [Avibacterium paragallinarum]|uniref:DUF927 domain-containing protein n=1 Tax=Avibacterium paragallinarum TaxID=728 RepID=UPI0010AA08BA|nr:hypothetical protein JO83_02985 [Avibacterium paragallinarum]
MKTKLKNAPFLKDQPNEPLTEMLILAGAEAWQAWGKEGKGQGWHLLTELINSDHKQKPVILGGEQLEEISRLRLAPEKQKFVRIFQFGELTQSHINAICLNLAKHSEAETVSLCDNIGQLRENLSDYIARLRNDEEAKQYAEQVAELSEAPQAEKSAPFIEYRTGKLNGLYYVVPKLDRDGDIISERATWLCDDLKIVGRGISNTGQFYYIFQWKHAFNHKTITEAMPTADLGKSQAWDYFKTNGLRMSTSEQVKNLVDYFHIQGESKPEWIITNKTGWTGGAYLLPNGEIIGEPNKPIIFTNKSASKIGYGKKGSAESWREEVGQHIAGNASMMLGVATALASPLLAILNADPFGVHLFNQSSKGKTTTLNIANSIYGNPKEILLTWNTTPHGINNEANSRNDGFLTLDELGQAKKFYEVENIAYSLFNGSGRIQGMKEGGNHEINRWKITALSTGEKDLETYLQTKGIAINAGQLVRLLNIPIAEPCNLSGFRNAKEHADHLNQATFEHYGVIGREWLKYLTKHSDDVRGVYDGYNRQWLQRLPEGASGQVQRVASRFAILETALQLARDLTGWSEHDNSEALIKCFNDWLAEFGIENREEQKIPEMVTAWILENRDSRFIEIPKNSGASIRNTAGYRILRNHLSGDREHFYIYPKAFNEAIGEHPTKIACDVLISKGMLKPGTEKAKPYVVRVPKNIDQSRPRSYLVYLLEEED